MGKLKHYIKCTSTIELLTGLHIGGPKDSIKIGGIDNPVIRNPITQVPYIPGSSLKGRFRMALELKYGDHNGGEPSEDNNNESKVCLLFGNAKAKKTTSPTRFIFRDANLSKDSMEFMEGEEKIEVKIDRIKGAASVGGNRTQERIAAGAKFDFEVMIRVFEGDNEEEFKNKLKEAAKIVESEFLGGSGSRGYGQIKFSEFKFEKIDI